MQQPFDINSTSLVIARLEKGETVKTFNDTLQLTIKQDADLLPLMLMLQPFHFTSGMDLSLSMMKMLAILLVCCTLISMI